MADTSEIQQLEFRSFELTRGGAIESALVMISVFLERDLPPHVRSRVLGHRANLLTMAARYEEARTDLVAALLLAQAGSYHRYSLELALELDARRCEDRAAQIVWAEHALATAVANPTIAGHNAALAVLGAVGDAVTDGQRRDCLEVLFNVRKLLGLEDGTIHVDLVTDLRDVGEQLNQRFSD